LNRVVLVAKEHFFGGFRVLLKILQNQRSADSRYFRNLKEVPVFVKEPTGG